LIPKKVQLAPPAEAILEILSWLAVTMGIRNSRYILSHQALAWWVWRLVGDGRDLLIVKVEPGAVGTD